MIMCMPVPLMICNLVPAAVRVPIIVAAMCMSVPLMICNLAPAAVRVPIFVAAMCKFVPLMIGIPMLASVRVPVFVAAMCMSVPRMICNLEPAAVRVPIFVAAMCMSVPLMIGNPMLASVRVPVFVAAMCMPAGRLPAVHLLIRNLVLAAGSIMPVFGAAVRMPAVRLPAVLFMIRNLVIAVPAVRLAINNYMLVVVLGRGLVRTMFGHVDVHGDAALRATICGLIRSMAAVVLATVCCLVMYNRVTVAVVVVIHMRIMFARALLCPVSCRNHVCAPPWKDERKRRLRRTHAHGWREHEGRQRQQDEEHPARGSLGLGARRPARR